VARGPHERSAVAPECRYDGEVALSYWDVVAIVIGPVLPMFMSPVFAEESACESLWVDHSHAPNGTSSSPTTPDFCGSPPLPWVGVAVGCVIVALQPLLQPGHDPFVP